jgi:URI fold toxin 2
MHGNAKNNQNPHHLYDIFKIEDKDIWKFGISDDPIEEDGLSARVRDQVEEWNMAAEYRKFDAEILLTDIPDRVTALNMELRYINAYYEQHGRNPIANKYPKRK